MRALTMMCKGVVNHLFYYGLVIEREKLSSTDEV